MKAHRLGLGLLICLLVGFGLAKLQRKEGSSATNNLVRGLRTYKVAARAESRVRRFPSILQPADLSVLVIRDCRAAQSDQFAGRSKGSIGRGAGGNRPAVTAGASRPGKRRRATSSKRQVDNAEGDFQRKQELLKKGVTTQAAFDQSKANLLTAQAQLDQARHQLELANHNLDRSKLLAPFAGPSPASR